MSEAAAISRPRSGLGRFAFPVVIVGLVLGGLALVVRSSTAGGVYDMTLGELAAQADQLVGKEVRVNGVVQAGSFHEAPGDQIDIAFAIGDAEGHRMKVRFRQILPDAFQEGRQVIVQGKLASKDEIECTRLTVKCPSKYKDEAKTDEESWKSYDPRNHNMGGQPPPAPTDGSAR